MSEWEEGFHHALWQVEAWLLSHAGPGGSVNGLLLYDDIQRLKAAAGLAESTPEVEEKVDYDPEAPGSCRMSMRAPAR